jgi:hypothetical protein
VGLHDLNVIHDDLEHGAEIIYEETTNLSSDELFRFVRDKSELGVFTPRRDRGAPDYRSKDVLDRVRSISTGVTEPGES